MKKTVSVIIPTYNRLPFLKKAVGSVLSQSYKGFELIVVDDGSDDGTAEWVEGLGEGVVCLRQERRGPSAARNAGIEAARTDLFAFLDSDDRWREEKLEFQLAAMEKSPEYPISHTEEVWYRRGKLLKQQKKHRKHHGRIFRYCLPLCAVSLSTVIARRGLFERVGLFDEGLPCCEDYDFWLRAAVRHPFLLVDRPLTLKDGGREDQVSFIHRHGMDRFRIESILKVLKDPVLIGEERQAAEEVLKKKCRIYGNGCLKWGRVEEGKYYLALPEKV